MKIRKEIKYVLFINVLRFIIFINKFFNKMDNIDMRKEANNMDIGSTNMDNIVSNSMSKAISRRRTPADINNYNMSDQQNYHIQQGMYDGGQPNLNYKIPQIKGEV